MLVPGCQWFLLLDWASSSDLPSLWLPSAIDLATLSSVPTGLVQHVAGQATVMGIMLSTVRFSFVQSNTRTTRVT